ncbi:MAG TPA: plastocyanin/azurin family copper-binding protein [Candidatus Deferrimicrobiaceae bacterium]|nr:plastocyanin/azurin family copper-binding protein [Candidatus Deferrimicrobiaceae bacterium]
MKVRLAPLVALFALMFAACSAAPPTLAPDATPSTRIEVRLTDALRIEPNPILVPAGVPVTFVVTNAGVLEHEVFFGDEEAQDQHRREVAQAGGVPHDGPNGIAVKPGETREFSYTFEAAGSLLAGCHVPGHYPAGMKASVVVR